MIGCRCNRTKNNHFGGKLPSLTRLWLGGRDPAVALRYTAGYTSCRRCVIMEKQKKQVY
ncbi:MAG: hypothetical protein LBQ66_04510 [Planctomycetaceae bacterium]|nr:hypothetical protein [Planctomycetaceae bacterium]